MPEEKCIAIYNAVEVQQEHAEAPPLPPNFQNGQLRVITVGGLIALKNVDKLFQAIAHIPQVSLAVVGDGPCKPEWEALTQALNVSDRVWFTGALPRSAVHGLMRQHDVFAIFSSHEAFPFSAVEAMTLGLTVIGSRRGGIPEIVQDSVTGLLISPEPEAIAQALHCLFTNPDLRRRLASTGQKWAQEQFSCRWMVDRTEEVMVDASGCRNSCALIGGEAG